MSVSVFEHPILSGLLGDEPVAAHFSAAAEIDAMLRFESALAVAEEAAGVIPEGVAAAIDKTCTSFAPDMHALKEATRRDGVCVPELVRQLREALPADIATHVHFGATSQDVIDTSLVLRLQPVIEDLRARIETLLDQIGSVDARFGGRSVMAHTRMQSAIPISVSDKLSNWRRPVAAMRDSLHTAGAPGAAAAIRRRRRNARPAGRRKRRMSCRGLPRSWILRTMAAGIRTERPSRSSQDGCPV